MAKKKEFTHNEAVALMDRNAANCLRLVAEFIRERGHLNREDIILMLEQQAERLDEAAIDIDMLDSKGYSVIEKGQSGCFLVNGH